MATATVAAVEPKDLIIDIRETALHEEISVPHDFKQLHVGDIHIGRQENGNPVLLIERKTYADFQSSIMDGRYREQRGRLLAAAQEMGSKVAYILEGNPSMLRGSMTESSIQKLVSRLFFKHGIPVFRSVSVAGTANLVEMLHGQWFEDKTAFQSETTAQRAADGIHVVKKNNTEDPAVFGTSLLCLVPGVSVRIAEAWLAAFNGSAGAVLRADQKALADIKVGARRVGDAVAARAINIWSSAQLR